METDIQLRPGTAEVHSALGDESFETIVETLRRVLTLSELPRFAGCDPCRSSLDRIIIEDPIWREVRGRQFGGLV